MKPCLARIAKRDVKNSTDDVKFLAQIGLVVKKETNRKTAPVIAYDKLLLEIAVEPLLFDSDR